MGCLIFVCNNVLNLTILCISLRWKCCFCIKKYKSFRGLHPLDPHQGLCPWIPPGPLSGPLDPTPQGSRALGSSIFCTVLKHLINGAPSHPLPSGTLKQSYATESTTEFPGQETCHLSFMFLSEIIGTIGKLLTSWRSLFPLAHIWHKVIKIFRFLCC